MPDRAVPEGTTVTYTTALGEQRELVAAGEVIHPETAEDETVLDGFGFPAVAMPTRSAKSKPDTGEEV